VRFALLAGFAVLAGMAILSSGIDQEASTIGPNQDARRSRLRITVFFAVSFSIWLYEFGYQRYAVPLELLTGPVFLCLLGPLMGPRFWIVPAFVVAIVAFATVKVPDWGHVSWTDNWYGLIIPAALEDDATFVLGDSPVAYAVPSFSPQARFLAINSGLDVRAWRGNIFSRRIAARLADQEQHPPRLITAARLSADTRDALGSYGLDLTERCQLLQSHVGPLFVCDLALGAPRGSATMRIADGTRVAMGGAGNGFLILGDGWFGLEHWGVWGAGPDSMITFRSGDPAASQALLVRADIQALVTPNRPEVDTNLLVEGRPLGRWHFTVNDNRRIRELCIPAELLSDGKAIRLDFHTDSVASPQSLGINSDQRVIGIGLISVQFAFAGTAGCGKPAFQNDGRTDR
jgi:hypothetical protein